MIVYKTLSVFDSETNTLVRRVCLIVEYGSGGFSWVLESRTRSAFLKAQLGKYAETDHSSFAFHFHSSMAFDPSTDLHCKYISKEAALREGISRMHTVETEQDITALYQQLD